MKIDFLKNQPQFYIHVAYYLFNQWPHEYPDCNNTGDLELLLHKCDLIFVIYYNNKFIGCASIQDSDWNIRPDLSPWLSNVFIHPEYRNKGIAKRLIERVLKYHNNTIYLWSTDFTYYKQFGFKLLDKQQNGKDIYIFKRKVY